MKIEIVVDGKVIHKEDAPDHYRREHVELINDLSRELGVQLGEFNLTADEIVLGVHMLKMGWTPQRLHDEIWSKRA